MEEFLTSAFALIPPAIFSIASFLLAKKYSRPPLLWGVMGLFTWFVGPLILFFLGDNYKAWPTVEQYLDKNPDLLKEHGIECISCGSTHIHNWGISSSSDPRRVHLCDRCGAKLYRSGEFEV